VLCQEHTPGKKLIVDWAGGDGRHPRPPNRGGHGAAVVRGGAGRRLLCLLRAFEYLGGCPKLLIPDTTKTGVIGACRYYQNLNLACHDMAMDYGIGMMQAPTRKPREKAKVEFGLQVVQRVTSHWRCRKHGQVITNSEYRPRSDQTHPEWTPSRMVNWAAAIGTDTTLLFERILADKFHPEVGYCSCLRLIRRR